jgi:hypothetical protein
VQFRTFIGQRQQFVQARNRKHRNAELGLDLLRRGSQRQPAFLAIDRNHNTGRGGAVGTDQLQRLPDRGASRDDIVDDQDAARERRADYVAAFAVRLGLLAVECHRNVAPVLFGKGNRRRGGERDAFVGRAKQHVERDAGVGQGRGIGAAEPGQCRTGIERSGIEKIRADPSRLERELAET